MSSVGIRTIVVGFVLAFAILAALLWAVGIDAIVATLRGADVDVLPAIAFGALVWLLAWGLVLHAVLGSLDAPLSPAGAVAVYAVAVFVNNVTPFAQAGGEPFSALFISRATDREYEIGLAAIASTDAIHVVPSVALGVIGVAYYGTWILPGGGLPATAAIGLGLLAGAIVLLVAWRRRKRLRHRLVDGLTVGARPVYRLVPTRTPPTREAVNDRVTGFVRSLERVADDRRALSVALCYSALGWIALSATLWLSLYALGHAATAIAVLVAIPIASVAAAAPLPGGLAAIETVLSGLVVAMAGVPVDVAIAAVILYRIATYWFPLALGAGVAGVLWTRVDPEELPPDFGGEEQ